MHIVSQKHVTFITFVLSTYPFKEVIASSNHGQLLVTCQREFGWLILQGSFYFGAAFIQENMI